MAPKWSLGPSKTEPKWGPGGVGKAKKSQQKREMRKSTGGVDPRPLIFSEKVAKMAPTWLPKWSQNGPKIDAKIDQNFDGFRDRFLEGFWWILGAKMEPSWGKNGMENRYRR